MQRMFSLKERVHGSDTPLMFRWQKTLGNYLATTGHDNVVRVWDRHGQLEEEIQLPGSCTGMEWDKDGDVLCFICEKSSTIFMWDANQKRVVKIDSGAKDAHTLLCWSRTDLHLAIGTAKGNLILYDHKVGRKVPIIGKHTRKIVCGHWSAQNLLALGGTDNGITISDVNGKTLHSFSVRDQPSLLRFSEMKRSVKNEPGENTVSLVVGKKTLYFFKMYDPDNIIELAFQPRYGKIEAYHWYGDGYIMIGFSNGFFVVISTHAKEIGQELFQVRNHHDYLSSIAISPVLNYAASCGDTNIRIHDLRELSEINAIINVDDEPKGLREIDWTTDGQLLAVSTARGTLHCYLTKLPMLGDSCGTKIAYLTSLLEVTVENKVEDERPVAVTIDVEPTFVACGPYHLAVGMNNRAWFYYLSDKDMEKTRDREYLGTIESMSLNMDYAAVLVKGKVQLHVIDQGMHAAVEERESKLFPEREDMGNITCSTLTNEFLIYGTDVGTLNFFFIEDWSNVNTFRHLTQIRNIYPDSSGSHVAVIDDKGDGFIYNPVNDSTLEIPSLPAQCHGILWENNPFDKGVFVVFDDSTIYTYIFHRESVNGPHVSVVGTTHLPFTQRPLLLYNGTLTLQLASGKTTSLLLDTHSFLRVTESQDAQPDIESLEQAMNLRKWREAWVVCEGLNDKQQWTNLGHSAVQSLEVDLAVRVYRHLADAGMVMALEKLRDVEDSFLLAGSLASFLGKFDLAQDLLLSSSQPIAALEMRRDLMHWDTALQLANRLDSKQIPFIAKEYGQQLEFTGNYTAALSHYEKGVTRNQQYREHDEGCAAGMARTAIRLGDIRRGVQLAMQHPSRQLKKECGVILEGMRQYAESAVLFEKGEYYDKAAAVYIKSKNWSKVGELLPKITSLKIHLQYAKAKEADGKFKEAADAYRNAKDHDNQVRVYLDHLRDPEKAVKVVKESGSVEGAKMVARFFVKLADYGSAIQFLVLSKCNDEAFQMAQQHGQMEIYAEIIGEDATKEDFKSIAVHFENEKNHLMAGKFFSLCEEYARALKHYLKCSSDESEKSLDQAIRTVALAKDDNLTRRLIDFLMGETDGMPRDANYLFKLYMAMEQYSEAAQTAIIISKEEQKNGNYRIAHDLLFSMMRELKKNNIRIPSDMENNLMILHSYVLIKNHMKRGNHLVAARMLIRVAENISKFPNHIVPILTSTVIECHKSGLHASSFSYAAMLMRPEYRTSIDAKYRKKIEQIVRKTGNKADEEEQKTAPCPHCDFELVDTELVCPSCRNNIPYCIATGRHITRDRMSSCPKCNFPAFYLDFQNYLDAGSICPMCSDNVTSDELLRLKDPEKYLNK
uniref:WD repeat-containing protein 19-like n=1 Tax=Ciona intestinalis TaxID=7719 RepID=UPI000180CD98|nr:WD repeat-containing protein 19-like [Ciona intestinalis]|eukprot:XP_002124215.1 WD repeat-containing protein 19-like [Ciona intestinalis]